MKTILQRKLTISIISILMAIALTACGGGGNTDDTGDPGGSGTEPAETEYVPVIDEDADELDGITIRSAEDLAKIGTDRDHPLDGDYYLVIDLDISGMKWTPIGGAPGASGAFDENYVFTGTFDGRGHRINGLTIDTSTDVESYWGLFGSVGSSSSKDPAVIKNIIMTNVSVNVSTTQWTGVGAIAGQVNGYAVIDSIALMSGSVRSVSQNAMNIGTGSLLGQCRTSENYIVMNEGVSVRNIFSNVDVTAENYGIDMGGGVLGRIRGSNLAELCDIVYTGKAVSEGAPACAIASGDSRANSVGNLYFLNGSGRGRDGLGTALSGDKLADGTVTLSDAWTVSAGGYPLLTSVIKSPAVNLMDMVAIGYAAGDSADGVGSDLKLPTKVLGRSITWTSNNEAVISVSNGTGKVTPPAGDNVNVKLTADCGAGKKTYTICVIGTGDDTDKTPGGSTPIKLSFATDYVEAGKPIELEGVPAGAKVTWTIVNYADGKTRTETTDEPCLTLGAGDSESLITASVNGKGNVSIFYSTLPVIYIESSTPYFSPAREYFDAEMTIAAPEKYADLLYDGKVELRLRGNSTAELNKKPFKLKLDKKANLLGIDKEGKSKHWVLLSNARDPSLLRNKVLMDFSEAIGTEAYISSESVTLIYNGEYCGVYQLAEHVRVGDTRVNVFDWEEYAEDAAKAIADKLLSDGKIGNAEAKRVANTIEDSMLADWSWMTSGRVKYGGTTYKFTDLGLEKLPSQTGGFLLEMDFYHLGWGEFASVQTAYAQPLYFNTPEPVGWESLESFYNTNLYNYTYRYVQSFEYAVHSDDFVFRSSDKHYMAENWWDKWAERVYTEVDYSDPNNNGKHYSEMFDMDSLVQNFIFCEIAMNWDSMKNSFFVYKDTNELAKIGPQWDFDWALGNDVWVELYGMGNDSTYDPEVWHCRDENFMREQYYQEVQWNCLLARDPYFLTKVYESWEEMRDDEIEGLVGKNGTIKTYSDYIRRAAAANDAKWADIDAGGHRFDDSLARLNGFVSTRMRWLDGQFTSIDTFVNSIGVYHASNKISVPTVSVGANSTTISVKVTDSSIKYINFQINGTTSIEAEVKGGTATVKVDNGSLDADGYNCVVAYARDSGHNYIIDAEYSDVGNYNQVVSNYKSFKVK